MRAFSKVPLEVFETEHPLFLSHITSSPLLSDPIRHLTPIFKKLIKMYRCLNPIQGSRLPSYARRGERSRGRIGDWVMRLEELLRSDFVPSLTAHPSLLGGWWSVFGTWVAFAAQPEGLWGYGAGFYVAWGTLTHLSGKWLTIIEDGRDLAGNGKANLKGVIGCFILWWRSTGSWISLPLERRELPALLQGREVHRSLSQKKTVREGVHTDP